MNQSSFSVLKRLYSNNHDWVMIVDEQWKIHWNSWDVDISDLRERLLMEADNWNDCVRPFTHEGIIYNCQINSSREDGLRVLQFHPALEGISDFAMITGIVQAMISTCTAMFENMDEMVAYDLRPYLNVLVGDILHIYRIMFLEQENKRCMDGELESETFALHTIIEPIAVQSQSLMRHFATVQFNCVETPLFVKGDLRSFRCAALSAFLMCFLKPEQTQDILISLRREGENAILKFSVTAKKRERTDREHTPPDFGDLHAEKLLLQQYCQTFGIQTAFSIKEDTASCRMILPLAERGKSVRLGTGASSVPKGYFDPVLVMLARVHFRNYF